MHQEQALRQARPVSHWTGWGQWLALLTMTIDHMSRHVLPADHGLEWTQVTLGRIAFPLFAAMVAWHGLFNTRDPMRYARRILIIGLAAQIPFMLMPRASDALLLNVCFTLSLGLMWGAWLRTLLARYRDDQLAPVALLLAVAGSTLAMFLAGQWVEYGLYGLMLIPLMMLALYQLHNAAGDPGGRALALLSTLPVLFAAGQLNISDVAKGFTVATCVLVLLLAAGAARRVPPVAWEMPRKLWLSWYPGHFALIAIWLWFVGGL